MSETNFEGHDPENRDCGEHRTVGAHRAWCYDCAEWCYPREGCRGCRAPGERAALERLRALLREADAREGGYRGVVHTAQVREALGSLVADEVWDGED